LALWVRYLRQAVEAEGYGALAEELLMGKSAERPRMTFAARVLLLLALVWAGYVRSCLVKALARKDPGGLPMFVGYGDELSWGWLLDVAVTFAVGLGAVWGVWGRGWRMHLAFWWAAFFWSAFWATGIFAVRHGDWLALVPCAVRSLVAAFFLPAWGVRTAIVAVQEHAWPLLGVAALLSAVGLAPFLAARDVMRCLVPGMELPERSEPAPAPRAEPEEEKGLAQQPRQRLVRDPHAFDGLAGVDEAVVVLREAFEMTALYPEIAERYRLQPHGVFCLRGRRGRGRPRSPGRRPGTSGAPSPAFRCPISSRGGWGESEQRLHQYFEWARRNAAAILFFDEIDAIGMKRDGSHMSRAPDILLRVLLEEIDGFRGREEVFVLAATSRADTLDPALLRPGQFDRRVHLGLPRFRRAGSCSRSTWRADRAHRVWTWTSLPEGRRE